MNKNLQMKDWAVYVPDNHTWYARRRRLSRKFLLQFAVVLAIWAIVIYLSCK